MAPNPYDTDLDRNPANFQPLTFLERAASVFPDRTAIVHGALALAAVSPRVGDAKGEASHHRGAYLMVQGNALTRSKQKHAVFLRTLPMFHRKGWYLPWTLSAIIGTHVCLRQVRAGLIWRALAEDGVTHPCGAPIVMSLILSAPDAA